MLPNNPSGLFTRFFLLLSAFILCNPVLAQIDPQKRDSLARSIEREKRAIQAHQDSFTQHQDSLLNAKQTGFKNTKPVPAIHKDADTENRGNTVLLPVALAVILLILFMWKRKRDRRV